MRVVPLDHEHIEGLRLLRNQPTIRPWFIDTRELTAEQQSAWYSRYLDNPNDHMWVGLIDGEVVAAIGLTLEQDGTAEVGRVMVDRTVPAARGSGKVLMHVALAQAANLGLETVFLDVRVDNVHALRLYQSLGFEPVGERLRRGQPVLRMQRQVG